jgi:hypothetical protein
MPLFKKAQDFRVNEQSLNALHLHKYPPGGMSNQQAKLPI